MSAYYALTIMGLCLLMGYAGQVSLGHAGFFAIGGYITAFMTTHDLSKSLQKPFIHFLDSLGLLVRTTDSMGTLFIHIAPWISLIAAVVISALAAVCIGIPALRLKGHYLAMATLGFGIILYYFFLGTPGFGGADGISDVPRFTIFKGFFIGGSRTVRIGNYYAAWSLVISGLFALTNLVHSRTGRAMRAIHDNEDAAMAMGVNTAHLKILLFVLSAVLASIGGFFMTHFLGGIGPSEASVVKSVRYLAIVAVGGMANLPAAIICGIVLNFLSLRGFFGSYDNVVFGTILVMSMLLRGASPQIKKWFIAYTPFVNKPRKEP
jgi:branched-chain amino acid transport system permease protein